MKKQNIFNFKNGFTLIEMVVSIAVFLLISGVAVGIFLSIIQRQKEVLSEQELLNQISYAEEYMSRALRMAKASTSNTDGDCLDLGNVYVLTLPETEQGSEQTGFYKGIKFLNQTDGVYDGSERNAMCEELFLDNTTDPSRPILMIKKGNDPAIALTSPDMKINYIRFSVNGGTGSAAECLDVAECPAATNSDETQPRVTILLNIEFADQVRRFQTTISQRNLNVNP